MRLTAIFKGVAFIVFVATGAIPAFATIIVSVGSYNVSAGTPITAVLSVSNSSSASASDIEGMTLTVQIDSGTGTAPEITSLDLLTGTIWAGHVSAGDIFTPSGGNQLQYQSRDLLTDTPGDFVDANGLLGTVSIDTTGATAGDYSIKLIGTKTAGRDSVLVDGLGNTVPATFGEGELIIAVPEPSSILLAAIDFFVLATIYLRRRNSCSLVSK